MSFKKILKGKSLKANVLANLGGNIWSAILSIVFVPLYLKYIGSEGYGLIGIFASVQVIMYLLDSGLSTTLNRELARLSVLEGTQHKMGDLVRTLEVVYWILACSIGAIAFFASPFLAYHWVQPKSLSPETVVTCFRLLSITLIFQFPIGFYNGGLLGLQLHVHLNVLRAVFNTIRGFGAVIILIFFSHSVIIFFSWFLFVAILNASVLFASLWKALPKSPHSEAPSLKRSELKSVWRFTTGIGATTITAILLTQLDKIILSKTLSLSEFGYYSMAVTLGMTLAQITGPVTQSFFPRLTALVSSKENVSLRKTFHQGCQLVCVLTIPCAIMLIVFSKQLLIIWTNDPTVVINTWLAVSLYTIGTALNGLMSIPYMLTIAFNWTRLGLYQNIVLLFIMIPVTIFASMRFGAAGGAASWALTNFLYILFSPGIICRRIMPGETFYWYWSDTIKPMLAALFVIALAYFFIPVNNFSRWPMLLVLILIGMISLIASLFSAKDIKELLMGFIFKSKLHKV